MKRVVSTKRQPGGEGGILQIRGAIVFLHISNALRTWSTWFCVECVVWGVLPTLARVVLAYCTSGAQ